MVEEDDSDGEGILLIFDREIEWKEVEFGDFDILKGSPTLSKNESMEKICQKENIVDSDKIQLLEFISLCRDQL